MSEKDSTSPRKGYPRELLLKLQRKAKRIRVITLQALCKVGSGHCGGALSVVEILCALYFHELRIDPKNPRWEDRDRFVLSKGHACAALYAILAEAGFFPAKRVQRLRQINGDMPGHPDMKTVPGVDMSTGSLGQGISAAVGMALGARILGKDIRIYCIIGDGESQSGQVWEAAMAAAHYRLDNLVTFLDYNGLQIDGPVAEVMNIEPVAAKWRAFGWHVLETAGHDFQQILAVLDKARSIKGKPTMIIAHTTKGKGISFMENVVEYHGKVPTSEQLDVAIAEIEERA